MTSTTSPSGVLSNGRATVASLHLAAFLASGFGPAGLSPGFLERLTYSIRCGRLSVMYPLCFSSTLAGKLGGCEYKEQPIVGWKKGIDTRPGDYVSYEMSNNPFVPGDHPLAEAEADEREVNTVWGFASEEEEQEWEDKMRKTEIRDALEVPDGCSTPSDVSLPLEEGERHKCSCPRCHCGPAEGNGATGGTAVARGA